MTAGSEITIKGNTVDEYTRCVHYHSSRDVIAIKFKCCHDYYPCFTCHEEQAGHEHRQWKRNEFNEKAIFCGICKTEMTINEYLNSNNACPFCGTEFNPNCSHHYHLYFEL